MESWINQTLKSDLHAWYFVILFLRTFSNWNLFLSFSIYWQMRKMMPKPLFPPPFPYFFPIGSLELFPLSHHQKSFMKPKTFVSKPSPSSCYTSILSIILSSSLFSKNRKTKKTVSVSKSYIYIYIYISFVFYLLLQNVIFFIIYFNLIFSKGLGCIRRNIF